MSIIQKKIILLVLVAITACTPCRHNKEIEQLFKLYEDYSQVDQLKALGYAKQASLLAEKEGNSKEKAYSYIYISRTLFFLGYQKESIEYMEKAMNEKQYEKDVVVQAMVKQIKHNNFNNLKLYSEGMKESLGILELLKNKNTYEAARIRLRATGNVASYYRLEKNYDKARFYIDKAILITKEPVFINKDIDEDRSRIFIQMGKIYHDLHKVDSALHYLKKSVTVIQNNSKTTKYLQYSALGYFYNTEGNLEQALKYYLLTAEDIELRKWEYSDFRLNTYQQIARLYGELNDSVNKNIYQQKYNSESLKKLDEYDANIQKTVRLILNEKEQEKTHNKLKYTLLFFTITLILMIIGFNIYKNNKKKRELLILEKDNQLDNKEIENKYLKQKLAFSLDEIKDMAKKNDPLFLVKFQEHFPQFQSKLLKINQHFQTSELELLAYIYLNFQTKEIADYTFKSPKTIQNRKHTLRKKLGIPASDDMYIWIKSNCT